MNTRMLLAAALGLAALAGFFLVLPTPEDGTPTGNGGAGSDDEAPAFAIVDALVFDGERFHEDTDVLVRAGRVEAVGADLELGGDVRRVNAGGKTLLPGLVDAHVHVFRGALRQALRFGVTTVLDMFSAPGKLPAARQRRRELDHQARADLYSAGILATAPGGHGTQYGLDIPTLRGPDDADAFVAARVEQGSDWIKIVYNAKAGAAARLPSIDRATLRALIDAAHRHDRMAVVHVDNRLSARHALADGADGLAHVFADAPVGDSLVDLARERGAFVIPTLPVLESVAGVGSGALLDDPRVARYLDPTQRETLRASFGSDKGEAWLRRARDNVATLHRAGVPILAGSDAPNPGTAHGASLHRALALLREAGLSPAATLAAATSRPADAFGLADRGRIEAGALADLVLIDGDPRAGIEATRGIERIWKDGHAVDRERPDPGGGKAPPAPPDAAISDFESGTVSARFGHGWRVTTDRRRGGNSTAEREVIDGGAGGSDHALAVRGEIRSDFAWPWAGVMFFTHDEPMQPVDFSAKSELVFDARGDGRTYRVMLFSGDMQQGAPPHVEFTAADTWQRYTMGLDEFSGADVGRLAAVAFTAGRPPGRFDFVIDNLAIR